MTTQTSRIIPVTDTRGTLLLPAEPEPEPGSVLLTEGVHGTAWQRHFADGLWHSSRGGRALSWRQILATKRNVVLIYDAPERRQ